MVSELSIIYHAQFMTRGTLVYKTSSWRQTVRVPIQLSKTSFYNLNIIIVLIILDFIDLMKNKNNRKNSIQFGFQLQLLSFYFADIY